MMRISLFLFWVTVVAASLAISQTASPIAGAQTKAAPATKKTPPKTIPKATSKSPPSKTAASAKKGTGTKTGKASKTGKSTKKNTAPVRRVQATPTPERYKDIQAALIAKGYLHGEPTGVWDSDSMDAMRRFQTDQKQTPTGKITAPSLIGLGLGPKPGDSGPVTPNTPEPATPAAPAPAPVSAPPQP